MCYATIHFPQTAMHHCRHQTPDRVAGILNSVELTSALSVAMDYDQIARDGNS